MEKTEWICSNCGTKNDAKFCTFCGTHMPTINNSMVWICSRCGLENAGKYCTKCGQEKRAKETFDSNTVKVNLEKTHPMPTVILSKNSHTALSQNAVKYPHLNSSRPKESTDLSNQASSTNKQYHIGIIIILILLGIGGWYYFYFLQQPAESTDTHTQVQETMPEAQTKNTEPPQTAKQSINSESDFGLGKVALGDTLDKVHENLGQETKKEARNNGLTAYVYEDVNVIVNNGIVTALESNSELFATKLGVHQGSSLDDVLAVYKQEPLKSSYEDLELYEYDTPNGAVTCRLRFAINTAQKVDYISIREIPRDSGAQVEYERNPAQSPEANARRALYNFHSYITQHQLRKAYNCLSPALQGRMTYEGWAPGFNNTVRSNVSNVSAASVSDDQVILTYDLTAVDNPGGTNHFKGTVTVIRTAYGWKIDYIENH